jgi:hypothetical protein
MKKTSKGFAGRVNQSANDEKHRGASYGYLTLPNGVKVFKEKIDTKVLIDILPYVVTDPKHMDKAAAPVGEEWYKKPFKLHRYIGSSKSSVVCPTTFGKPCPICEYQAKLKNGGADKKELDAYKASFRVLYAMIPRDATDYEPKIHIWDISSANFQDQLNEELLENPEHNEFPSIEDGESLLVRFTAEVFGGGKPYPKTTRIDFKTRKVTITSAIAKNVPNLDEVLNLLSYAEIEAILFDDTVDDEEEDERPIKKGKSAKKLPDPEPEEDEDDDTDDNEDLSLEDQINACKSIDDLLKIAKANFRPELKNLKKITKVSQLKKEMITLIEPEEGEEIEEDEEDEGECPDKQINDCKSIDNLLSVAKAFPEIFKLSMKDLKKITKVSTLKKEMLTIYEEYLTEQEADDDLPFDPDEEEDDTEEAGIECPVSVGQTVSFTYKGKKYTGEVTKTFDDKKLIYVQCDDRTQPHTLAYDTPLEVVKKGKSSTKPEKSEGKEKCPHGHKFGVENDEHKECSKCKVWEACLEKQES